MASKVLVVGAPQSDLASLFTKLAALHSKQSFALCLLLGDLLPAETTDDDATVRALLAGEITIPLPTYFTLGAAELPPSIAKKLTENDNELCTNLFFLGKRGVLTTSEGIRIVALGGKHDPNLVGSSTSTPETSFLPFYSGSDAAGLRGANHADLLVTYEWPEGIQTKSSVTLPDGFNPPSSPQIAELVKALRPRYHFTFGDSTFYEREPYRNETRSNDAPNQTRTTRFLSIASFGNPTKSKSLYAFTLNPHDTSPTIPPNATPHPFTSLNPKKRPNLPPTDGGGTFFWGNPSIPHNQHHGKRPKRHTEKRPPPGPAQCFFCLSNPNLEKHLIVSIGTDAYLTTAKGPLTSPATNPAALPFSAHILIIPLAHTPTLDMLDSEDRESTVKEMRRYRDAIVRMLEERGCGAVVWEVRKHEGVHAHWQLVPVRKEKLRMVEEAFAKAKAGWVEENEIAEGEDAFTYWVAGGDRSNSDRGQRDPELTDPSKSDETKKDASKSEPKLIPGRSLRIPPGEYFDLQFGRRVLSTLLDASPETMNWRDCVLAPEEEAKDAESFKSAFKGWDFTMVEE
ncbi:hypothetical protein EX30DRAFT_324740 [Ascodesmis nigricans]|uniref:CwfJ domain-containing protein n=1 Tax=Ascodesmis nigricans TaxID=341454 RepID=A0A4S2MHZ6_9PEZI|nr:hypothetical protein EX30DRAFT_324740 [Ascodesmis nigricans]